MDNNTNNEINESTNETSKERMTYLVTDGRLFKIGESSDPERRIKSLMTANPHVEMICYGNGVTEKYLHELYYKQRVRREWFDLNEEQIDKVKQLIEKGEKGRVRTAKPVCVSVRKFDDNGIWNGNKQKRVSGKYHTLADWEKKRNADGRRRADRLNEGYVMPFGKYKGTKLREMVSDEQVSYCEWLFGEKEKKEPKSRITKALRVHLRNIHRADQQELSQDQGRS